MTVEIFGIKITAKKKAQVLEEINKRIKENKKTFIVTPYSEFFYRSFRDYGFKEILNSADLAIPDGIGTLWLAYYFSIPLTVKNYYLKIIQAFWQMVYSGAQILLQPKKLYKIIPEKIPGADFFWDLVKIAEKERLNIFLLGGYGNTPKMVTDKIHERFPNANVVGYSNAAPGKEVALEINAAKTDLLMVAYGPVRQEYWIKDNLKNLNVKIAIGLGGTFDYVAGKKIAPPKWIRSIGLEWFYRLFTQPRRFKRIWNGTVGIIKGAIRHKVFQSLPYRKNVCLAILNQENKVFVARRNTVRDRVDSERGDSSLFPDEDEHWQFPQGGVDNGEDLEQAALRECREETNMTALKILGKSDKINYYEWNATIKRLWLAGSNYRYKGQAQHIIFLRYLGDESEIHLEHEELTTYKWIEAEELPKVIHAIRQNAVKIILEDINKFI